MAAGFYKVNELYINRFMSKAINPMLCILNSNEYSHKNRLNNASFESITLKIEGDSGSDGRNNGMTL